MSKNSLLRKIGNSDQIWSKTMQPHISWCDLRNFLWCFSMIAHNKFAKAISQQPSPQNLFYSKLLKNLKNSVFTTFFQLYFLANEITTVHRSGTFFIEYVFEFYFQWSNYSYVFWDSSVWTPLTPKLGPQIEGWAWFSKQIS